MRGLACLVLLAVACSSAGGPPDTQGLRGDEAAGASQAGAGAPQAGAVAAAGGPSAAGGGDESRGGDQASAGAPAGGAGGSAGKVEVGGAPAGGAPPAEGGSGAEPVAGQGGAPAATCSGFVAYTVDAGTCLSVTGDYEQQPDPDCSPTLIVSRDHCSTCASWTAVNKPLTVMLAIAPEATMKTYDAPGGTCPSTCKYICK